MAFELIGAIALGFVAAGIALFLVRLSGGRIGRAIVPISAGVAMLGFGIWSDYSWAGRTQGELPPNFVVLSSFSQSSPWRPWTYVLPVTERFSALDRDAVARNPDHPDLALAEVFLVTRRMPVARVRQIVDCRGDRRAQVTETGDLTRLVDGSIGAGDLAWIALPEGDSLLTAACETPVAGSLPHISRG
ncbi:hypothetical protein [Aureimonas mangrovi]|uniref:hypothetical protein n=1 Tax=Aureimonas mangrovi TaxID=2758041 RepID=UPI00163D835E|nr:hypothetical protein [Aureimonas mangrovi]